ncbi:MAG TPA: MFS transporter [Acidimicrobiia bacterium]|nr:MFS transporter [Acidimicrobiia bacterium]
MTAAPRARGRPARGYLRGLAIDVTPLRESRDFRLLWGGELLSQIGSQVTLIALFVQVYRLTSSSLAVGFVGLAQLVVMMFVSIGFGPQIDRRDRRHILMFAQTGLMAASALLLWGAHLGDPPLVLVYGAAAMSAGFVSISMPTRAAMTPRLVAHDLLPQAAALNQMMWNGAAVVGPAIGGIVVARVGLSWAYGIDVLSFVASLTAAFLVRSQRPERMEDSEDDQGLAAVFNGLRYLRGKRVLQSTFTIDIVAMVFGMPRVLFTALAISQFHGNAETVGWLFAAPALGAFLGAATSGWIGRIHRPGFAIIGAVTVWGSAIVAFGLVGDNLALAVLFLAIAGGADVISAVFRSTMQQLIVPDGLRGRISAINIFVVAGGPRLGDFEGGLVAAAFTPTVSVVSGGLLCLAGVALIATTVPRFARWRAGDPP